MGKIAKLESESERVKAVASKLGYIKTKGARDLLITFGLCRDVIAFDQRLRRVVRAMGLEEPKNAAEYRALENAFREAVPALSVSCLAHLDRILFQNVDAVVRRLSGERVPNFVSFVLSDDEYSELRALAEERGIAVGEMAKRIVVGVVGGFRQME